MGYGSYSTASKPVQYFSWNVPKCEARLAKLDSVDLAPDYFPVDESRSILL